MAKESNDPAVPTASYSKALPKIAVIIALIGIVLSLYTVSHHLELKAEGVTDAACNINQTFSCDDVAASEYSEIAGIPLGIFGTGFFLAMLTLVFTGLFKPQYEKDTRATYKFLAFTGVIASVALGIISFTIIGKACINCMGVYALCLAQAGIAFAMTKEDGLFSSKSLSNGLTFAIIPIAVVILAFNLLKPAPRNFKADHPMDLSKEDLANLSEMDRNLSPERQEIPVNRSAFSGYGEDYRSGPDDAKVVIVEFADFQCPACQRAYRELKKIKAQYGDKVQVVYKNYPLDMRCNPVIQQKLHEFACDAAAMARCAGNNGRFEAMHDMLFDKQSELNRTNIISWGMNFGLSKDQAESCLTSEDILTKIKDDINLGNKVGVNSTPTLFVNGRKLLGSPSSEVLGPIIDELLIN